MTRRDIDIWSILLNVIGVALILLAVVSPHRFSWHLLIGFALMLVANLGRLFIYHKTRAREGAAAEPNIP